MATVKDVISQKNAFVARVGRDQNVLDATRIMHEKRIGSVVVTEGDSVVGIFSERDLLDRVVAARLDPAGTQIADVMTTPVAVCHPDSPLEECRTVMTTKRLRHLPVVVDGQLVGIISSGDILAAEAQVQQQTIEYLHEYLYGQRR